MPQKIIIDTDPGQDDAIALLLAFACPEALQVLAVTTVAGNVPLDHTTRNACKIRQLAGRGPEIPVHAGCSRPLILPLHTAEAVHGPTGLEGSDLPEPTHGPSGQHAVDALIELVRGHPPGAITLCTLGPLTNVAVAMVKAPDIIGRLAGIVAMGGAARAGGNSTPAAEFNMLVDPHAARIVVESGVDLVVASLDVTHQVLSTPARVAAIAALGTPVARQAAGMITFYGAHDRAKYGWEGGPLHDPCVIAWLLAPELFRGRRVALRVTTDDPTTHGQTVVDWWGVSGQPANALWLEHADAAGFYDLLTERLARL